MLHNLDHDDIQLLDDVMSQSLRGLLSRDTPTRTIAVRNQLRERHERSRPCANRLIGQPTRSVAGCRRHRPRALMFVVVPRALDWWSARGRSSRTRAVRQTRGRRSAIDDGARSCARSCGPALERDARGRINRDRRQDPATPAGHPQPNVFGAIALLLTPGPVRGTRDRMHTGEASSRPQIFFFFRSWEAVVAIRYKARAHVRSDHRRVERRGSRPAAVAQSAR